MISARLHALIAVGILALGLPAGGKSARGFIAMPLMACLDVAGQVVLGRIAGITEESREHEGNLVWGRARVEVSEVLKGKPCRELEITVAMEISRDLSTNMQCPPRVYRQGDEGLWLIGRDGKPSHAYGLLGKGRREEVRGLLKELEGRAWSEEVGGIRVWAALARHDVFRDEPGRIIFAARNVSGEVRWLPRSVYREAVRALARDPDGNEQELAGIGSSRSSASEGAVACLPLEPGMTRYLHPDGEDYAYFQLPRGAGRFTVTVSLGNTSDGKGPGGDKPVHAWKGRVSAPPFPVEVPGRR